MANTESLVEFVPPFMDDTGDIVAAAPVLGPQQWRDMALAASWLIGRGGTLVCNGPVGAYMDGVATSAQFAYAIHGREQIKARIWFVGLALASGYGTASATGTI